MLLVDDVVCFSVQSPCMMYDPSENGLFGVSDYDQIEDESFPPLPPPLSPGEGNFDEEPAASGEGKIFAHTQLTFV